MWRFYICVPVLLIASCGAASQRQPTASVIASDDTGRATIRQDAFRRCWDSREAMARGVMGTPDRTRWQQECDEEAGAAVDDAERTNTVNERSESIADENDLNALQERCVADAHAAATKGGSVDFSSHRAECDDVVEKESGRRADRRKRSVVEAARKDPRCRIKTSYFNGETSEYPWCDPRTQEDCDELRKKLPNEYVTGSRGGSGIRCDRLPTRQAVAARRTAREQEACTTKNAREKLDEESLAFETESERTDLMPGVFAKCVEERATPCQKLVDTDDLVGAAACWSRSPWGESLKGDPSYEPSVVIKCLQQTTERRSRAAACFTMPDNSDEQIVAKADCVRDTKLTPAVGMATRCGHLDVSGYYDRASTGFAADVQQIEAKAKEPRTKLDTRNSVCGTYQTIALLEGQMKQQQAIERESGVVDLDARRQIGATLVLLRNEQSRLLSEFKRLWKRSLNRASDCAVTTRKLSSPRPPQNPKPTGSERSGIVDPFDGAAAPDSKR